MYDVLHTLQIRQNDHQNRFKPTTKCGEGSFTGKSHERRSRSFRAHVGLFYLTLKLHWLCILQVKWCLHAEYREHLSLSRAQCLYKFCYLRWFPYRLIVNTHDQCENSTNAELAVWGTISVDVLTNSSMRSYNLSSLQSLLALLYACIFSGDAFLNLLSRPR